MDINKIKITDNAYLTRYKASIYSDQRKGDDYCVLICPGGGWFTVTEREGEPVALSFLKENYTSFVLHYSTSSKNTIYNAIEELKLSTEFIMSANPTCHLLIIGFSAGAQLAALYTNKYKNPCEAVILCYPCADTSQVIEFTKSTKISSEGKEILSKAVELCTTDSYDINTEVNPINFIGKYTPPTFIWHTSEDELIPVTNSLSYANRLSEQNIPFELHIYEPGLHGLSLANTTSASKESEINEYTSVWFNDMLHWLSYRRCH